jgi:hypothetical protein
MKLAILTLTAAMTLLVSTPAFADSNSDQTTVSTSTQTLGAPVQPPEIPVGAYAL